MITSGISAWRPNAPGNRAVVRNTEALLDVTYQAQIVPSWILQPTFGILAGMRQSTMRRTQPLFQMPPSSAAGLSSKY
jgi:hypothetical protein